MDANEKKQAKRLSRGNLTLSLKVGRLSALLNRYHQLRARNHGIFADPSRGQGRILALLAAKPKTTQRELSYLLDMRQQSLSELLAKLEEKGFVTREKSPDDGRVTVVTLTEAGRAAVPSSDQMESREDLFECFSDGEREQFEQLLDKAISSLEERLVAMGEDPTATSHAPKGKGKGKGELRDQTPPRGWDAGNPPLRHA